MTNSHAATPSQTQSETSPADSPASLYKVANWWLRTISSSTGSWTSDFPKIPKFSRRPKFSRITSTNMTTPASSPKYPIFPPSFRQFFKGIKVRQNEKFPEQSRCPICSSGNQSGCNFLTKPKN